MGVERKAIGTLPEWMRNQERLAGQQERRRTVTQASDLLGPGFGPTSTLITDWTEENATFSGFFFSAPLIVTNSPDDTKSWIGLVLASPDRTTGVQQVWSVADGDPVARFTRRWFSTGDFRLYTGWQAS